MHHRPSVAAIPQDGGARLLRRDLAGHAQEAPVETRLRSCHVLGDQDRSGRLLEALEASPVLLFWVGQ